MVYGAALRVAAERAPFGFDAYFIALAMLTGSMLMTGDKPVSSHARALGVGVILVRVESLERIVEKLAG